MSLWEKLLFGNDDDIESLLEIGEKQMEQWSKLHTLPHNDWKGVNVISAGESRMESSLFSVDQVFKVQNDFSYDNIFATKAST